MAKIDKVKETINILKFWLGIAVATLLALSGWLVLHYDKTDWFIVLGSVVCVAICATAIYYISKIIMSQIQELEEL